MPPKDRFVSVKSLLITVFLTANTECFFNSLNFFGCNFYSQLKC